MILGVAPSLADFETRDALHGHASLVEDRLHGLLRVLHRRLVKQGNLLVVAVQTAVDDPRQRLLGLALLACRGLGDLALLGHHVGGNLVAGHVARSHRGDLHRGAASHLAGFGAVPLELHQHDCSRRQGGRAAVHVRRDGAVENRDPAELDLLADLDREPGDDLADGGVAERHGREGFEVGRLRLRGGVGDLLSSIDELVALSHEVGLAVQLDQRRTRGGDQPGGCRPLRATLLGLGGTLDAQDLDGLVEVAVGLLQCFLAVHHARAGDVAELLDVGGGDVRHVCGTPRDVPVVDRWRDARTRGLRAHTGAGAGARSGTPHHAGRQAWVSPSAGASGASDDGAAVCSAGVSAVGTSTAGTSTAGVSAAGVSAAGVSAGVSAAGVSAAGVSAAWASVTAASPPVAVTAAWSASPWRSSRSHSASGSSEPISADSPDFTPERAISPSATASATTRVSSPTARIASSLPGIGKSTSSGSQLESRMPMIGIRSLRASSTARCSLLVSTIHTADGVRVMSRMPPSVLSSLICSRFICSSSFLVRLLPATSSKSISSSSLRRLIRWCTVWKFVSMPPSQRWLTYGMPTRVACSEIAS